MSIILNLHLRSGGHRLAGNEAGRGLRKLRERWIAWQNPLCPAQQEERGERVFRDQPGDLRDRLLAHPVPLLRALVEQHSCGCEQEKDHHCGDGIYRPQQGTHALQRRSGEPAGKRGRLLGHVERGLAAFGRVFFQEFLHQPVQAGWNSSALLRRRRCRSRRAAREHLSQRRSRKRKPPGGHFVENQA